MNMEPTSTLRLHAVGGAALLFAIERKLPDVVELLIKDGGDINTQDADRRVALHFAIDKELLNVVELLIEHGADINV